jgi:hypothetical protein
MSSEGDDRTWNPVADGPDVGIQYDRRADPKDALARAAKKNHSFLDQNSPNYKGLPDAQAMAHNNTENALYDKHRNETRARWMNRSHKEEGARLKWSLSEYGPQFPQQLTEDDFTIIAPTKDPKTGERNDIHQLHKMHSSRRDRNPRYADEFILALQEGAQLVDDDDENQILTYVDGVPVLPKISWATTFPLQFAYSPTLPFFRQPSLLSAATVRAPLVPEREPPLPVGDSDSAGWLDRYATQRLTPWVYVSPSSYSQTDIQFRTPRMDVLDTSAGNKQLTSAYTHYTEGAIPCVTNALSRNSPHGRVHDLSYAHMSIEDAMEQSATAFHCVHSPWEQGVSLVHFKFGSAETDDVTLHATEGLPPRGERELYSRHEDEHKDVKYARTAAENELAAARAEVATADAAARAPGHSMKEQGNAALHWHTKEVTKEVTEEVTRLEKQLAQIAERAEALGDLLGQDAFEARDAERVARQNALRHRAMNEPVRRCRSSHLDGGVEDPRCATRLIAVAEQTAIKWMEDCGLSSSVTLRDDVDPVHAGRKFNLVLRPPIEAFAYWQESGSMWSDKMGWHKDVDSDLATYRLTPQHTANFEQHFQHPKGMYSWVVRLFGYEAPLAGRPASDRVSGSPLYPHTKKLSREDWNVIYMRTRGYESRLISAKRYYLNHPIELLSSSATMSHAGYERINTACLGCIYTGVAKFAGDSDGSRYKWPNPMPNMVTYLTRTEVLKATGDERATDGFYHVAIVFLVDPDNSGRDKNAGNEASVEHVIPQQTISKAARLADRTTARRAWHTPMHGDGDVRDRFANYVCGDPFNWLISVANPNRRRGALPLGVCGDDLAALVVDRRAGAPVVHGDVPAHEDDDDVRGAHDHLFPVPRGAWLRVALVQIYMYLTYPGLPPLMGDDVDGGPLDGQGRPTAGVGGDSIMGSKEHARFGSIKVHEDRVHFMLPGFDAKLAKEAPALPHAYAVGETRGALEVGKLWLQAILEPPTNELLVASMSSSKPFPTHWDETHVSARTGRVVMTTEKRIKLFRILLRTVATDQLCEADVLLAGLVQKATGFMLSEYEQMCARLDAKRHDGKPLTSSDGLYAAWDGNSDGMYGATIRTRYPRGWRNPLFHWSARRRHGFVQQPTVFRFLGAAMYGLSNADATTAANLADADVAAARAAGA